MAGWQDSEIQLSPYIQQQPIEAMRVAGQIREQKFQEGIETVQSIYSSLLALPLAKREDQEYVKQKVNSLNNVVRQSISGDFSNQRLINQIGGLASQISSDPTVQTGVQSTARMQAGLAKAKADQELNLKNGKNPIQNTEYLNEEINKWLTDGQAGSEFKGEYTPYVDIIDRAIKLYKEQNPSQNIDADSFRYDEKGNITVNPTLKEGINPQKIQSVLNLVYSQPDVQKQLSIEGWWNFRGSTPTQLGEYITQNANLEIENINSNIRSLQLKGATDATANKSQIASQIEQLKNRAIQIQDEHTSNSELLLEGKESQLKTKLAQQGITSNFINAYSTEISRKNPLWEVKMDIAKYELDVAKSNLDVEKFKYQKEKDVLDRELEAQKALLKFQGKLDENGNPISAPDVFTVKSNNPEEAGRLGSSTFEQHYQEKVAQMSQAQMGLVFSIVNNSDLTESGFNPITIDPATGGYKFNVDPTGKTGFTTVQQAKAEYDRIYTEGRTQIMGGTAKSTLKQAYAELDPILRTVRNLESRKKILDSKKQVVIDEIKKANPSANPDFVEAYIVKNNLVGWENSKARLVQKYGPNWAVGLGIEYTPTSAPSTTPGNVPTFNRVGGKNSEEYKKFASSFDKSLAPRLQAIEDEYRNSQMVLNPLTSTVLANKPEEKENIRQIFSTFATATTRGNDAYGAFRKLIATKPEPGKEDDIYGFQQDPLDKKFYITIKRGKGQPEKMEITEAEFNQIPGAQSTNQFWQKFGDDLSITNNTTTDVPIPTLDGVAKPGGINTAYILEMPPTSKYEVRYHVTGDGVGAYNLKLYILDKKGNILSSSLNPGFKTGMSGIMTSLDKLKNDQIIEALLK